jgi:hypothetical protein
MHTNVALSSVEDAMSTKERPPTDLIRKLLHICNGLTLDQLKKALHKTQSIDPRSLEAWEDGQAITSESRDKIIAYLATHHQQHFDHASFDCSWEKFLEFLKLWPKGSFPENIKASAPDAGLYDHYRAVAGTYQTLRPHAGDPNAFIGEPLQLAFDEISKRGRAFTFSHNAPFKRCLYSGDLRIWSVHALASMTRRHDQDKNRWPARALSMHIDYGDVYCFTGQLIRGAKSQQVGRMTLGIPFIAMRPERSTCDLTEPEFKKVATHLRVLGRGVCLGTIDKNQPAMLAFCRQVFTALADYRKEKQPHLNPLVLASVPPSALSELLTPKAQLSDSCFAKWLAAMKTDTGL